VVDLPDGFVRHRAEIADEMRAVLAGRDLPIYDMVRYALGWQESNGAAREGGGKGIRPSLTLITAEALRPDAANEARKRAVGGAAAIELVHTFSLVHDDIQDGDLERHHRETVWVVWGRAQAINVGDALRELSEHALRRSSEAGVGAESVLAAQRLLSDTTLEMIEGQYMDLEFEGRSDVSVDQYLAMIERKTGAMIGCSMAMAGLLAIDDAATAAILNRAGRRLGLCFQIRDDWLGIWGDSDATGKSSDNDIRRRKKTYPIVYAFERADQSARATLDTIYAQETLSEADVDEVLGILARLGAAQAADAAAAAQLAAFSDETAALELSPAATATFDEVAQFMLQRDR